MTTQGRFWSTRATVFRSATDATPGPQMAQAPMRSGLDYCGRPPTSFTPLASPLCLPRHHESDLGQVCVEEAFPTLPLPAGGSPLWAGFQSDNIPREV